MLSTLPVKGNIIVVVSLLFPLGKITCCVGNSFLKLVLDDSVGACKFCLFLYKEQLSLGAFHLLSVLFFGIIDYSIPSPIVYLSKCLKL